MHKHTTNSASIQNKNSGLAQQPAAVCYIPDFSSQSAAGFPPALLPNYSTQQDQHIPIGNQQAQTFPSNDSWTPSIDSIDPKLTNVLNTGIGDHDYSQIW